MTAMTARRLGNGRRAVVAACLAGTVTALAACNASGSGSGSGGGGGATGAPNPGATVNVVDGQTPNQFDPCGTLNGSEVSFDSAIYATLIRSDPATGKLSPGIATSWQTAPDKLSLTLTLQSGLTFQDGTPLNAATVVESVNQCLALGNQAVPGLKTVSAQGDKVVFTLTKPSSGLVDLLGSRLGMIASPAARSSEGSSYGSKPVGAGPYKLDRFVPGSSIRLVRWDGYKPAGAPAAKAAVVSISIITDPSAQAAAIVGGQADYGFHLDPTTVATLKNAAGITLSTEVGVSVADLNMDRSQGPLRDVRVRQAISYAIDRKALANAVNAGLSDVASEQPYPPDHPYHMADLDGAYPYDTGKAKQLLAAAGYPNGLTLRGLSLDGSAFVNTGVVVSQQLAQVGIKVTFAAKALPDATKSFYTDHQYDIFSTGMNSGPDWLTIYRRLLSSTSAGNAGKVALPGGDAALERLNQANDPAALVAALRQANVVYQQQLPIVPLYFAPYVAAWSGKLIGGKQAFAVNGEADLTALGISG
jgi:peptide/nickel transport system substrate-binding protein